MTTNDSDSSQDNKIQLWVWIGSQIVILVIGVILFSCYYKEKLKFEKEVCNFILHINSISYIILNQSVLNRNNSNQVLIHQQTLNHYCLIKNEI